MASRRKEFFPEVTDEQWNDWHWQVKNRIETLDQLKKYIKLTEEEEEGVRKSLETLRMAITPYYLSLIDPDNPYCPIRKQSVPTIEELHRSPADLEDPLHEDGDSPVPGLTHRYPDRVLFLVIVPAVVLQGIVIVPLPKSKSTSASSISRGRRRYATCCFQVVMPCW